MIVIDQHLNAVHIDGQDVGGSDLRLSAPACQTRPKYQRGAIAIMFAVMLLVFFGFMGFAFGLSMLYNRKAELQAVADTAAVAAANQLVGTNAGVQAALNAAAAEATNARYHYHRRQVTWTNDAIRFSSSATASESDWLDAGAALASPGGLFFARVDTGALDADIGTVDTVFMSMLPDGQATSNARAVAVAGRASINITPLAICALSNTPAKRRQNSVGQPAFDELEEYGFRRGVGYDLMKLNSIADNNLPAENFVIDPIAPLGSTSSSSNTAEAVVAPFVCAGKMPRPRVMGAALPVTRPFRIDLLFNKLNSRFDQYTGTLPCSPTQALPDANIKAYAFNIPTSVAWMKTPPAQTSQAAALWMTSGTIASALPIPAGTTADKFGPLWTFAKAVPFSSYVAGTPEPSNGYATFPLGAWANLYNVNNPGLQPLAVTTNYPAGTPYSASGGSTFLAPSVGNRPGSRFRRVLNVPLLSCPVVPGTNVSATVLAIGKFFMTVPATSSSISVEFAGLAPEQSLGGTVELLR